MGEIKTYYKINSLNVNEEEFKKIKSKLEEMSLAQPTEEMKNFAEKMGWPIVAKEIILAGSDIHKRMSSRVDFYSKDDQDNKNGFIGSIDYSFNIR